MSIQQISASTCAADTERGEHVFKISDYSLHRGLGVGYYIQSPSFAVGGHQWCIHYYPDGYTEDRKHEEMTLGLELITDEEDNDPATVRVSYTVSLFHWATQRFSPREPCPYMSKLCHPITLLVQHVNRSEMEAGGYVVDDCLTIKYAVTVFKEARVLRVEDPSDIEVVVVKVPPSDIVEHLGKLLLETKEEGGSTATADVTFEVQGEEFAAHKLVLAMRSPVFKAELYGPMKKDHSSSRTIVVHDMQPAAFRDLLYFIYNDSLPAAAAMDRGRGDDEQNKSTDMIRHLLVAADRYAMERLKLVCESLLSKELHVDSVATTLALADRHSCVALKEACIRFVASSAAKTDDLVRSEAYLGLKRTCPSAVMEMWEKATRLRKT